MLKPRKRITKKELKEDPIVTFYFKAQDWIEKNMKFVTIGAAVVAVVIIGSVFYVKSQASAEKNASVDLFKATQVYNSRDYKNAVPMLTNLVDSYGSTSSGKIGRLYLANALYNTDDYSAAATQYKKFASSFKGDEFLKASALAGYAACIEQQGDFETAANEYIKAAQKYAESSIAAKLWLKGGQCFQSAGNVEKAKNAYDKIVKDYADSTEKNDAVVLLAQL